MSVRLFSNNTGLAVSVIVVLAGCGGPGQQDSTGLDTTQQSASGWNGQVWNGQVWNGQVWNGQVWNGQVWNGQVWNGQVWNGLGWNGASGASSAFTGIGWNPAGYWVADAWGGAGPYQTDCWPSTNNNGCTTLHNWINHNDVNGNGIAGYPNDATDIQNQVSNLGAWVSCACPSNVAIPFSDTHGMVPATTFYGGLGLAPTWCGSDPTAVVPVSEQQIVSACLMAKINMKGKHYPLSLRSLEAGTAVSTNEGFLSINFAARYWGNLWTAAHVDYDRTTCNWQNSADPSYPGYYNDPSCTNPNDQGGAWANAERFSCTGLGTALNMNLQDQYIFGRDCEVSNCGDHLEYLGQCSGGGKLLPSANNGIWHSLDGGTYPEPLPGGLLYVPGSLATNSAPSQGGGTTTASVTYRGDTWRTMEVWTPVSIPVEDPLPYTTYNGGTYPNRYNVGLPWTQQEFGTSIPSGQSFPCLGGQTECQGTVSGWTNYYRKLLGLNNTQWMSINQTGYTQYVNGTTRAGDGYTPVTLAIRYQRAGVLGDHQCDTDAGCQGTTASECASGYQYANGACYANSGVYGTASSGQLEVYVMSTQANRVNWDYVHGTYSPYGKNIFPPTGTGSAYNTAYIYPVYIQNSYNTIAGTPDSKPSTNASADTLRVLLHGSTGTYWDAPEIDTAYFFAGTPTPDMDCTGKLGCWLYAGPNQSVSLFAGQSTWPNLGQGGFNQTPMLPPGTYTFKLQGVQGDLDLYVKANGLAGINAGQWDCRPYLGYNQDETCTMTLTQPGFFSIMVNGYANYGSSAATATLIGHN